ncbi:MAG: hypothetical protein ILA22_04770 [Prevotella sp.]|nr:hypothetical protein [Prevotella sp.]
MAQLNTILSSLMRDIIMAQHEANLYSYALREQYGREGKVKDFQLPGAVLGDIEMELNYGIINTSDSNEQYSFRFEKFNKFMKALSTAAAKKIIHVITDYVLTNGLQTPEGSKFFDKLKKQDETYQEYLQYIINVIVASYDGMAYELIDHKSGRPDQEAILNRISESVNKELVNDAESSKVLFNDADGSARKAMAQRITAELKSIIETACMNRKFKRTKSFPIINVAVTADELSTMPKESIHTCKLRFTPTTCNIRCDDNDDTVIPSASIEDIIK